MQMSYSAHGHSEGNGTVLWACAHGKTENNLIQSHSNFPGFQQNAFLCNLEMLGSEARTSGTQEHMLHSVVKHKWNSWTY